MFRKGLTDFKLLFSITTISPFSTSLTKVAPTISNAQVSDAIIYESFNFPITKGLIPNGSLLQLISYLSLKLENILLEFEIMHQLAYYEFFLFDFAMSWTIVSVSLVVLKIAPSFTNISRSKIALVKFPLCAMLKPPI